jgi:hypothetical protein
VTDSVVLNPSRPCSAKWLPRKAKLVFETLVDDLMESGVSITRADTHALSMAALCLNSVATAAKDEATARRLIGSKTATVRLIAKAKKEAASAARNMMRAERDAQTWLAMLAATPASRAKLGIKPRAKKTGAVANLLRARQR